MNEHRTPFSLVFSWTSMSQGCVLSSAELPELHLTKSQSHKSHKISAREKKIHLVTALTASGKTFQVITTDTTVQGGLRMEVP